MATRVERKTAAGADDLAVLHPHQTLTVMDNTGAQHSVTVREYSFIEGIALQQKVQPLLDDLELLLASGMPDFRDIKKTLVTHGQLVIELVTHAADLPNDFLNNVSYAEGDKIMAAWWAANGPFYMRTAVDNVLNARLVERLRAGVTSTNNSSTTATASPASPPIPSAR